MRAFETAILYSAVILFSTGCKTVSLPADKSRPGENIIGFWEGCDGRVIRFTKIDVDMIVGHYEKLGRLRKYKFTLNEKGYFVREQSPGVYKGLVKWKTISGEESWREVAITIKDDVYRDDGSDPCSKEMKRPDRI